jgi:hypothetical protein
VGYGKGQQPWPSTTRHIGTGGTEILCLHVKSRRAKLTDAFSPPFFFSRAARPVVLNLHAFLGPHLRPISS